jgi:bifunctional oligoribonuclease and PAP phosphatase NrnA
MQEYFTDNNQKLTLYNDWFNKAKNIVITSHQNPDGDAFGSALGMYAYLQNFSFESLTYISPTDYADYIAWMPNVANIVVYDSKEKPTAQALLKKADLIFCLDFSSAERVKDMKADLLASPAKKIIVDHHEQPESFGDLIFWNEKASSTCELVFQLIEKLQQKDKIDLNAATCFYTGLLTDTGSFKYDSTSAEVHRIAGELITIGINPNRIFRNLFDNNTFDRLQFLGYVLSQKMVYLPEYRTCYFYVSESELQKYNSKSGDTEGIVNYALSMAGVVLAAIFIEKDGIIKISFRSVDDFSVSELSRDNFSGGGHKNAAGGRSTLGLAETVQKFLNLLPDYKNKLLLQPN